MASPYEYGMTAEGERGAFGLLGNMFTPFRYPVETPAETTYMEADGALYPQYKSATYGEPEFGFQYMPAYRAISGLLSDPEVAVDAAAAMPEAMRQMANQQLLAGMDVAYGGSGILAKDSGESIGYDPLFVAAPLAPSGLAARAAGGPALGIFGGKTAKKFPAISSVETSDYEALLAREAEIQKAREKGMFAYPKDEWENMFGELKEIYTQLDPIEGRIKQQRQGLLDELDQVMGGERTPEAAFNVTERKYGSGIFKLPDDQYRFEINDEPAKVMFSPWEKEGIGKVEFSPSAKVTKTEQLGSAPSREELNPYWKEKFLYTDSKPLSEVFDHPELYENYPELENIKVSFSDEMSDTLGSFYPSDNRININVNSFYSSRGDKPVTFEEFNDKIADVLVHEIQHKVQEIEGFAKGANTGMSPKILREARNKAAIDYQRTRSAFEEYNADYADLSNASKANSIKHYEFMAQKDNIQPRSLFNQSDWYKYNSRIQSELGQELGFDYNKRKSLQRDQWLKAAFGKMAKYARQDSAAADRLANGLSEKELSNKIKELGRSLDKNRTANLDHRNAMRVIEKLDSSKFGDTYQGAFNVYQNVLGEAEARAVQARRGVSKGKQYPKRNFPFQQFEEGAMVAPPPMGLKNTFLLD